MTELRIVPQPLSRLETLAQDAQDRHDRITDMLTEELAREDAERAAHPLQRVRHGGPWVPLPITRQIIDKNDRVALWQGIAIGLFIVTPIYAAIAAYIFRAEIAHFLRGIL